MELTPYQRQIEIIKIVGVLLGIVQVSMLVDFLQQGNQLISLLNTFLGVFMLVFGTVKVMSYHDFSENFARYDLLAKQFKPYAQLYPLILVSLGALVLTNSIPGISYVLVAAVMAVALFGSASMVFGRTKLKNEPRGSIIKLRLSTITFVENAVALTAAVTLLLLSM